MLQATRKPLIWMAAAALLALPALAATADAGEEDVPITNPALLERLGFEPDATDVYATPWAYEQLLMSPAERAARQEAWGADLRAAQETSSAGGSFGTGDAGFTLINGSEFHSEDSSTVFLRDATTVACISGHPFFLGDLGSLPHGAKLERVDIRYADNSPEGMDIDVWRYCYPEDFDDGGAPGLLLGTHITTGSANFTRFASIGPLDEDIDRQSCVYSVRVRLDGSSITACSEGLNLRIDQVRAQWRRQVSPAPATATFDDVPNGHLFFKQIEALAASGVTGGCGGGDYCPDAPLTRGQMAAFLAKALGLHWGEISQP